MLIGRRPRQSPSAMDLMLVVVANIVGFFATAGAAGVDIASSNRDAKDVQLGGLVGVAGATIFTGCLALLIVAGTYGAGLMADKDVVLKPTELDGRDHGRREWPRSSGCCWPSPPSRRPASVR